MKKIRRAAARFATVVVILWTLVTLTGARSSQWIPFWIAGGLYTMWRMHELDAAEKLEKKRETETV